MEQPLTVREAYFEKRFLCIWALAVLDTNFGLKLRDP